MAPGVHDACHINISMLNNIKWILMTILIKVGSKGGVGN